MREVDTYDSGEKDIMEVTEEMPLSVRERKQTAIVYETFKEKAQWGEFYRVYGILLLALGGYFLSVPFYTVFCQTFGFSMSTHAKDYKRQDNDINVYRKFRVGFLSHTQDEIPWEFEATTA
jgi:cytochrome c oxidase assembly protein Cox11